MDIGRGLTLNLMSRGAAIAFLLLLGATLVRAHPRSVAARLGAAFAIGTALSTLADVPGLSMGVWRWPFAGVAAANMFVFWLFTRALLDDAFAPRPWHAGAWGMMAALGVANSFVRLNAIGIGLTLSTVGLALFSVMQSGATWREDLVEGRRRVRLAIVVASASYAALVAGVALGSGPKAAFASSWNAVGLACLTAWVAWLVLGLRADSSLVGTPAAPAPEPPSPTVAEAGADPRLVARLDHLMAVDRAYREAELSVGVLAERMQLPEHRLRKLINQGLGYRNFSAFLNGYRLADAKAALGDPRRNQEPILSIAMAAGFQSIGPFNRAFKQATGCTPSEYRRARRDGVQATPPPTEIERG